MNWRPADYIAIIFALSIAFILGLAAWAIMVEGLALSDNQSKRITGMVNGVIAIISLYVGAQIGRMNKGKDC